VMHSSHSPSESRIQMEFVRYGDNFIVGVGWQISLCVEIN
jgi:hypothetical protein